ncbi:MAG: carboxypeptidase regulatory-like domain-containing protein, partial [Bacteroidetes bacterium]|nr:carboxypeptidase regulatory-like domain-containing protein [Bacteroidota bacterium]
MDLRADLLTYDQGEHFAIYVDLINTSNNSGGPYPITGVVREITLPAGLQFLNTTADTYSSCFFEGTTGTCTSDSFPANQQATSVFYVSSIEPGSMTISGTKTQNEFDPDLNNNLASITILIEEVPEGSISGSVFEDKNGNGIKDTGEVAESGVTIALSGAITGSAVTDGAGAYTFTGLPGGDYSVTVQTGTYMGGTNGQAWHASAPETGNHSVTLSSGEQVTGKDFMIWQEARARIQVLHDYNANRAFDPGYSGISAVNVVRVDECPFNVGAVVASDANGWTSFGGLGLQEYCFGIAANQSFPGGTNGTELLISVPAEDNGVRQASHTFISGENV